MQTEAALRAQMKEILDLGVTQRALAERLDVSESWLSRWINEEPKTRPINVQEMDRFQAYLAKWADIVGKPKETARADASAGGAFPGHHRKKTGTGGH